MIIKNNKPYQEEFSLVNDVHDLRASIKPILNLNSNSTSNNLISGFVEIQELNGNEVNILGSISGLEKGSQHSIHIVQYNDLIFDNKENKDKTMKLKHLNPSNLK